MTYETLKTKLREVLEKTQELSKENGEDDTELRDFAASLTDWTQQCNCDKAQDPWRQRSSGLSNDELLWKPKMKRLPTEVW